MFRALLCPSSEEKDRVLPHMVFCTGCAGCGCVELGRKLCALCEGYCSTLCLSTFGFVIFVYFISLFSLNTKLSEKYF